MIPLKPTPPCRWSGWTSSTDDGVPEQAIPIRIIIHSNHLSMRFGRRSSYLDHCTCIQMWHIIFLNLSQGQLGPRLASALDWIRPWVRVYSWTGLWQYRIRREDGEMHIDVPV